MTETEYTNYGHSHGANGPHPLYSGAPCGSAMALALPVLSATALAESGGEPVQSPDLLDTPIAKQGCSIVF